MAARPAHASARKPGLCTNADEKANKASPKLNTATAVSALSNRISRPSRAIGVSTSSSMTTNVAWPLIRRISGLKDHRMGAVRTARPAARARRIAGATIAAAK